ACLREVRARAERAATVLLLARPTLVVRRVVLGHLAADAADLRGIGPAVDVADHELRVLVLDDQALARVEVSARRDRGEALAEGTRVLRPAPPLSDARHL